MNTCSGVPAAAFNDNGTFKPEYLNSMLYERIVGISGGFSPVSLARYVNSIGDRGARILRSMKHPQLSFNIMRMEWDDDGTPSMIVSDEGYDYVCARLKDSETHPSERSDLSKVRDFYRIVTEFDQLSEALARGNYAKAGRIVNRAVRA